ncbi:MAG: peptidase E [Candidatus Wallbacteria bacterium]|nr:peptidase E [Candidatus Wallbacteria bacterium]
MRNLITLGGGGFSMEETDSPLDRYMLEQTGKPHPRVCFLPTASGDAEGYIAKFHARLKKLGAETYHLTVFRQEVEDFREFILSMDAVYIGGGSTHNMLLLWKAWGLDLILMDAYERGVMMFGLSAGANCWFEQSVTDSWASGLRGMPGLSVLAGSFCPHFDSEPERRPLFVTAISSGELLPGYGVDDFCGLHFQEGKLLRCIASRDNASAVYYSPHHDDISEVPLEVVLLE